MSYQIQMSTRPHSPRPAIDPESLRLRAATEDDVALILAFIQELAEYERLRHEAVVTEARLRETLFGPRPYAEVVIAEVDEAPGAGPGAGPGAVSGAGPGAEPGAGSREEPGAYPVGFALFFHNYSTFLGRPGLYLEDLYVRPEARGRGIGRRLLVHLAGIAKERGCGRMEWSVLDWNEPAIGFYRSLGARPMDEWTVFRVTGEALEALAEESAKGARSGQ